MPILICRMAYRSAVRFRHKIRSTYFSMRTSQTLVFKGQRRVDEHSQPSAAPGSSAFVVDRIQYFHRPTSVASWLLSIFVVRRVQGKGSVEESSWDFMAKVSFLALGDRGIKGVVSWAVPGYRASISSARFLRFKSFGTSCRRALRHCMNNLSPA